MGIPAGQEFSTLVKGIVDISRGEAIEDHITDVLAFQKVLEEELPDLSDLERLRKHFLITQQSSSRIVWRVSHGHMWRLDRSRFRYNLVISVRSIAQSAILATRSLGKARHDLDKQLLAHSMHWLPSAGIDCRGTVQPPVPNK